MALTYIVYKGLRAYQLDEAEYAEYCQNGERLPDRLKKRRESRLGTVSARGNTPDTEPGCTGQRMQDPKYLNVLLDDVMRREKALEKALVDFERGAPRGPNYQKLHDEMRFALDGLGREKEGLMTAISWAVLARLHQDTEMMAADCLVGRPPAIDHAPEPFMPAAPDILCYRPSAGIGGGGALCIGLLYGYGHLGLALLVFAVAALLTFRRLLLDNAAYEAQVALRERAVQKHAAWERDARLPHDVAEELRAWWWERQVQAAGADDGDWLGLTDAAQTVLLHHPQTWLDVRTGRIEFQPAARAPEPRPPRDPIPPPSVEHETTRKFSPPPELPAADVPIATIWKLQQVTTDAAAVQAGFNRMLLNLDSALIQRRQSPLQHQAVLVVAFACLTALVMGVLGPLIEHALLR